MRARLLLCGLCWLVPTAAPAQLPRTPLSLENLDAFRPAGDNWQVAGGVESDRDTPGDLHPLPGRGVLVNRPTDDARDNLFTTWTHGDLELDLDVLMPKESNAGLYLQGRYEVQLRDSWGVRRPTYGDMGGLYERWDDGRPPGEEGYEGHPPRLNAGRAPGLWQHLTIIFEAPRFDAGGAKTTNARFVKVVLNGVVIHENVAVTGPTRGAAFADERPLGPLMIQGDHGPAAFRNIRYKRYHPARVRLEDVHYGVAEGRFEHLPDALPPALTPLDGITWRLPVNPDTFALAFSGTMQIPTTGTYRFVLGLDWITGDPHFRDQAIGGGRLLLDGRPALEHDGRHRLAEGRLDLTAGPHPFTLAYYKNRFWHTPDIAFSVEGPDTPLHPLVAVLPTPPSIGPIPVVPGQEPVVLRSFLTFGGGKRTHAVSVGDPVGVHYSLDLSRGGLLYVWRGPFLDAAPMWHSRGQDQVARPLGSLVTFSGAPSLALLDAADNPWPDTTDDDFRFLGYDLDPGGRPAFRYTLGDVAVTDRFRPDPEGRVLTRTLTLEGTPLHGVLWCRVATGHDITRLPDGSYAVDDRTYYVAFDPGGPAPVIRDEAAGQTLLLPARFSGTRARLAYTIIW